MTPPAQPDVKSIFGRALEIADPAGRAAYLEGACAAVPGLRAEVADLLAIHDQAGGFMKRPLPLRSDFTADHRPTEGPGSRVGPYKLLQEIGEGGMGVVYMAEQEEPVRRKVALKIIKPGMDSKQVVARFEAERQALGMMDHPNIARVFDAGTTDTGLPYFVMELVHGVPITEFCDANKLTPRERLELFIPVCQAIQHAHMKGIIHRDVKPSNVLVTMYDDKPVPKVIDFGVAKAVEQRLTEKTLFTQYGALVGTFEYMSPEQAEMNAFGVDTRSDVYSLGVLLYELLTGTTPLERQRLRTAAFGEVVRLIKEEEPPRPSLRISTSGTLAKIAAARKTEPGKLSGLVRGELDWIVMRCLEKDRTRRYDGAATLAQDVQRYLAGDAVEACPPTLGYRLKKAYRKNRAVVLTAVTVAAVLVFGIVGTTWGMLWAVRAEQQASGARDAEAEQRAVTQQKADEAERERAAVVKANLELARSTELQRKIRYAAEMNLLQAAHNAKDMGRVKKLLLAQVPKPGEPDDRGPEWHYWDRKLTGVEKEFTLAITESKSVGGGFSSNTTLSEDGSRVADVRVLKDTDRNFSKVVLRVWDADTGRLLKTLDRDAKDLLKLAADLPDQPGFHIIRLTFKNGHRDLLLHYQLPASVRGELRPGFIRDLSWNTETDAVRLLDRQELEARGPGAGDSTIHRSTYNEELTYRATVSGKSRTKESGLTIVRMTDEKVVVERPVPSRAAVDWQPDGQRFLLSWITTPARKEPGESPLRTRTVELWQVGGEKPVWTREDVIPAETSFVASPTGLTSGLCFAPDGKYYSHYERLRSGGVTANHYDLATGKLLDSRPLLETGFQKRANPFQFIAGGRTDLAFDAKSQGLAAVTDNGVTIRKWSPQANPALSSTSEAVEIEMRDGAPHTFALRSDGTLVTLHHFTQDTKLRHWRLPTESEQGHEPLSGVFSPDGTRYAHIVTKQKPATPMGAEGFAGWWEPVRLVVVDASGKKLLNVESTEAETILGVDSRGRQGMNLLRGNVGFVGNGRYFYYGVRTQDKKGDTTTMRGRLVVHDLDASRDVLRVDSELFSGVYFNREGTRYIVAFPPGRANPNGAEEERPTATAKLYEFPSDRLIGELKPPADKIVRGYLYDGENWIGHSRSGPEVYFDTESGKYLGERARPFKTPQPNPNERKLLSEKAAGSRVVKSYQARGLGGPSSFEIWDAAKTGSNDSPLFVIADAAPMMGKLSTDGKRLLVVHGGGQFLNQPETQVILYCADTGRPIVTLPAIGGRNRGPSGGASAGGFWSADGQRYFHSITPDGTLTGYDFRPRVQAK